MVHLLYDIACCISVLFTYLSLAEANYEFYPYLEVNKTDVCEIIKDLIDTRFKKCCAME